MGEKGRLPYKLQSLSYPFISKGRERVLEGVLISWAKHEKEVEAQRSENLPVKQKCQPLFT